MTMSVEVFDALALLCPFDIDVDLIRLGNPHDAGYVLAAMSSNADVLSFGVGGDVSFELDLAALGKNVHLRDHTVAGLPRDHPRFTFRKKGICGAGEETAELSTLAAHLADLDPYDGPLLLKMDVEGSEFDVFSTLDASVLERFEQIVIEIHWLENLGDREFRRKFVRTLQTINSLFTLFHVHANNWCPLVLVEGFTVAGVLELSYIRTDLVRRTASSRIYPTDLDSANNPHAPDHPLFFYPFLPLSLAESEIKGVVDRVGAKGKLAPIG